MEIGSESWRYQDRKLVCSYCGKRALYDGSTTHWQMVREIVGYAKSMMKREK